MSLSKLAEACRVCPFADKCESKRIEAVGCLKSQVEKAAESVAAPQIQPIARETMTIHVDGKELTVYRDEIERQLQRELYAAFGLQYGG